MFRSKSNTPNKKPHQTSRSAKSSASSSSRKSTAHKTKATSSKASIKTKSPLKTTRSRTWDEIIFPLISKWRIEIIGFAICGLGLWTLGTLLSNNQTDSLDTFPLLLKQLLGWGSYLFTLLLIFGGTLLFSRRIKPNYQPNPKQIIGVELLFFVLVSLIHQLSKVGLADAFSGAGGGIIGWALSAWLGEFLGPLLTGLFHLFLLILGFSLLFQVQWEDIVVWLHERSGKLQRWAEDFAPVEQVDVIGHGDQREQGTTTMMPASSMRHMPKLPPYSLLQQGVPFEPDPVDITRKKKVIVNTLADFSLPVTIDDNDIRYGPTVTQFGVKPGAIEKVEADGTIRNQPVRVGQIATLNKDLALALAVPRLRIEAPVPGRGVVGIEVPNAHTDTVYLRSILESTIYRGVKDDLIVGLGRDVSGMPVVTSLAKLPHLLIAGTTGSGKSVCLNALITNLIFNHTPAQLRLVLIDPKRVEMVRFNGLPHLLGRTETDHERVIGVLRWVTKEMDQRYKMLANLGAKNLTAYNQRVMQQKGEGQLPYLVVVIDELADLMAIYPADVERTLARLAQMARATGIHLVVATQRPSTDVITGLIKANFPARIAFSVASGTDSRVIIDTVGAENLMGRGDMLFLSADASAPKRVQGVFVSDDEIDQVVGYWQRVIPALEDTPAPWESLLARLNMIEQTDDLIEKAVAVVQDTDTISASLLQRKLRIGYPRAARLMETLYEMGMVEDPKKGGKTRRSLVTDETGDALEAYLSQNDDS